MLKIKTTSTPYWTRVIDEARERVARGENAFSNEHMYEANSWVTCACGKQDSRIPRNEKFGSRLGGEPKDRTLYMLGTEFWEAVECHDIDQAEVLLDKIEFRAAQVILEQTGDTTSRISSPEFISY